MAIDVTAVCTCDMCGRDESIQLREAWRTGRVDADIPSLVQRLPHWEFLDKTGYAIRDPREGDGKLLCESCSRIYKDTLKRQKDELSDLFSKGR